MSSAREQAREAAWRELAINDGPSIKRAIEAASDVWEAALRDIIRIASTGKICPSDAVVIERAKEALGE